MLMAGAAFLKDHHAEGGQIDSPDGVRGVAVDADRQLLIGLGDRAAVNGLLEGLGDTEVTLGTGVDDIFPVDCGSGIAGRQHAVGGMATGAGRRDHEAGLGESLAVDAHLVVLDNFMLRAGITQRRLLSLPVTTGTKVRDIAGKNWRIGIIGGEDIMGAVTISAKRRVGILLGCKLPVSAGIILLGLLGMADGAVYPAGVFTDRVVGVIDVDMALDAGKTLFLVNGTSEILEADIEFFRGAIGHDFFQFRIAVAIHAELVVHAV